MLELLALHQSRVQITLATESVRLVVLEHPAWQNEGFENEDEVAPVLIPEKGRK